jgi:general secretion pathway protein B
MSYILEALRRAESERGRRRGVPGLNAQPVPAPSPEDGGERKSRPWLWVVIGVSSAVLLMLLWRSFAGEPLVDEAALARAPVAGNVTPQDAIAVPAAAAAATTIAAAAASVPTTAVAPSPPAAPATAAEKPKTHKAASTRQTAAPAPIGPSTLPAATATAPRNPAPPEQRLRTLAELPDDVKRSVPALAFGGSVYSEIPAQRMVIFNGQVVREGESLSDDLLLEQIRPRSAVLRVRGQRFEITF